MPNRRLLVPPSPSPFSLLHRPSPATEPGAWSGPIGSAYGVHLVRVTEWTAATMPPYEEVIDRVRVDYDAARRTEADEAVFQALLDRYDVQVDEDAIQARLVTVAVGKGR